MKHVKMLGLLVMAAASLMAFASSASANPILTKSAGVAATEIHATLEKGTSAVLEAGIKDTCTVSTVKGPITTNNTEHAAGAITTLTFGEAGTVCTQDTTVIAAGSLTVKENANGTGTVYSEGSDVEVKVTSLGIVCHYGAGTGKIDIGTLTFGTPATMDINAPELPRLEPSNKTFCAATGKWTGSYVVTTPGTLLLT